MPAESVSLRVERAAPARTAPRLVCGVDEVGRGALERSRHGRHGRWSTPPSALAAPGCATASSSRRAAREALVPRIHRWAVGSAVGHASAAEIDEVGIIAALRLAGLRALAALPAPPDAILLDGKPRLAHAAAPGQPVRGARRRPRSRPVTMRVKADLTCASVAAASVLAKTERDAIMAGLAAAHPRYGWAENKGYASPDHLAALAGPGPVRAAPAVLAAPVRRIRTGRARRPPRPPPPG